MPIRHGRNLNHDMSMLVVKPADGVRLSVSDRASEMSLQHFIVVVTRWDERAGLRRDAVGSQVIDVL